MLSISLKQTKPFDWRSVLQQILSDNFGGDVTLERYARDIQQFDDARMRAVMCFRADLAAIESIKQYIVVLNTLESRVPELKKGLDGARYCDFQWTDSFKDPPSWIPRHDIQYERACMLFNLAVLEYQIARGLVAARTLESTQAARLGFLRSTAIFEYLNANRLKGVGKVPVDLSGEGLDLLKNIALAQAHESFLVALTLQPPEKAGPKSVAKVASQAMKLFDFSILLGQVPTLAMSLDPVLLAGLEFQKLKNESMCAFYMSELAWQRAKETTVGYGERVAWLQRSETAARAAWELARKKGIPESMFKPIQEHYNEISCALQEADQENGHVYLQVVPDSGALVFPDGHALQTLSIDSKLLEPSSSLFVNLLLSWMRDAEERFKSKLNMSVLTYAGKVSSAVREIREQLAETGLPGTIAEPGSLAVSTVPDALWSRIVNEVHAQGGVLHLTTKAQENRNLNDALVQKLKDLQTTLNSERDADENFRAQFGPLYVLTASRDLNALMIEDIADYRSLLTKAKQKDEQVASMLADNAGYLDLLTRTREQLAQFVPSLLQTQDPSTEITRKALSAAYQDLETVLLDCERTQAEFETATAQASIIPDLERLVSDATLAADCVSAGLDKLTTDAMAALDAKLSSLRAKFSKVLESNYAYQRMGKQNELTRRQEKALVSLNQALSRYADIASVVREGNRFYSDLSTQAVQLERGINDFCFVRNGKRDDGTALTGDRSFSIDGTPSLASLGDGAGSVIPPSPQGLRPTSQTSSMMRPPWKA